MAAGFSLAEAVILAGGLGTRLGGLTASTPKPLMLVKGRPFLEYQLGLLRRHGIRRILILSGYLGDQIEARFGTGQALGLEIEYSREQTPSGTGGALAGAAGRLPGEFFLVYGDSYLDIDYQGAYATFRAARGKGPWGLMVVWQANAPDDVGNVKLDRARGLVISYEKGKGSDYTHMDAGVLILSKEVVDLLPQTRPCALEQYVYPVLARQGRLAAFESPVRFYDIGTPERIAAFERSIT